MIGIHTCLVYMMVLVLGLCPTFPPEDSPDTAYDESETQPYESDVPVSSLMAQSTSATQTAELETQAVRNSPRLQTLTRVLNSAEPINCGDAHPCTGARSLLAHVCTLLF